MTEDSANSTKYFKAKQMKLIRTDGQSEIEGGIEELASTLAIWHGENPDLYEDLFSKMVQGEWLPEIPLEVCVDIVEGMGLRLFNDDGTPASKETVASLGRRAWERLQEIIGLEVSDEF